MASSNSSTSVVAIFAMMIMVLIAGFVAYRMDVFGGGGGNDGMHRGPR